MTSNLPGSALVGRVSSRGGGQSQQTHWHELGSQDLSRPGQPPFDRGERYPLVPCNSFTRAVVVAVLPDDSALNPGQGFDGCIEVGNRLSPVPSFATVYGRIDGPLTLVRQSAVKKGLSPVDGGRGLPEWVP